MGPGGLCAGDLEQSPELGSEQSKAVTGISGLMRSPVKKPKGRLTPGRRKPSFVL